MSARDRRAAVAVPKPGVTDPPCPAVVVFCEGASLPLLNWLRPGFEHCFVAVQRSDLWIVCDSLAHRTDLIALGHHTSADLAAWYREQGFTAVETATRPAPHRLAPVRPFTCVESVKRVLGIHAPMVFTPWQLHRLLTSENRNTVLTSAPDGPYGRL